MLFYVHAQTSSVKAYLYAWTRVTADIVRISLQMSIRILIIIYGI